MPISSATAIQNVLFTEADGAIATIQQEESSIHAHSKAAFTEASSLHACAAQNEPSPSSYLSVLLEPLSSLFKKHKAAIKPDFRLLYRCLYRLYKNPTGSMLSKLCH
ncbi:hypothetical protein PS15p_208628 [Mucor circinelloides]